ncbi:hypothetical protein [Plantactinospora sp. KBS50]|uniref:hypothetical protein n=1 Tax=Plantactinospora sp. KBS50 TaxID=2024580 RepID=UPI000BAB1B15|nr:hypothetical protein [Plantactinospora sp. KBS50]ASW55658.1 hypothetical protein CIK06_17920 [Plantactinospora sp. KBS50]
MPADSWYGPVQYRRPPGHSTAALRDALRRELTNTGMLPARQLPMGPFVIPSTAYSEVLRAARILLDLCRRTLQALAPDVAGRLRALGADPQDYPLFVDDDLIEEEFAACVARPDVVVGADGPRFVEINTSGAVGGVVETHLLLRVWRAAFAGSGGPPLVAGDPLDARAALFRDACDSLGVERRLLWVGSRRDLPHAATDRLFDVELEYLSARGFATRHVEPEDLVDEVLADGGCAYPLGLRQFTIPEWRELDIDIEPVRQVLKAGCLLLPTQSAGLLDHKKVLAMLSAGPPWLSAAERAFVTRYVPWTRVLVDGPARWRGARVGLADLVDRQRDRFVLKRGEGMKGLQVTIGRECDPARWRAAVDAALANGDSVVQEYVEPVRCDLEISDGDHETALRSVAPVLSPFVCGGRAAGMWARFLPADRTDGVVSRDGYGAMENLVVAQP